MGSGPAPIWLIYFHNHESRWTFQLNKSGIRRARRFFNAFWLIDDLTVINQGGKLESCEEIYPPELELKKGYRNFERSLLDLGIKIGN